MTFFIKYKGEGRFPELLKVPMQVIRASKRRAALCMRYKLLEPGGTIRSRDAVK